MNKIVLLQLLLLSLICSINANIITATAEMWPTGSSNMYSRKIALSIVITILGNYTDSIGTGTPIIQFSQSGFFGTTDNSNNPPCVVMINNVVSTITVIGYDMASNSMAGFAEGVPMNEGTTISIQFTSLNYVDTSYKNLYIYASLSSNGITFVQKRVYTPFHTESSLWSSATKTSVSIRFASANGFLNRGVLAVRYPSCASLPSFGLTNCIEAPGVILVRGISPLANCESINNMLVISNVYPIYDLSNSSMIEFLVTLSTSHTCTDSSYVVIKGSEPIKRNVIERAVLAGISGDFSALPNPIAPLDPVYASISPVKSKGELTNIGITLLAVLLFLIMQ